MRTLFFAVLAILGLTTASFAVGFGPLITAHELDELLGTDTAPLVLDLRGPSYDEGHIQGAVSAPYALFRGPADNPGALVSPDQLQATLRELGVSHTRSIVVVHQGSDGADFGAAARVYWTLKSSGLTDLAILDGGNAAWTAAGLPQETDAGLPQPSDITISFSDQWLASADDIASIIDGKREARLLDSRPNSYFIGHDAHPAATRPGTLPSAENVDYSVWFRNATETLSSKDAAAKAQSLGITADAPVVTFCNTGHWAAVEWFALSELAGVQDVKLYPESMVGWSQEGRKMANTPGLLTNLLGQFREK